MKARIAFTTLVILFVTGIILVNRKHPAPLVAATEPPAKTGLDHLPRHSIGSSQRQSSELPTINLARRLLSGEDHPKLTPAQLEGYLQANHRNADSLLAALYISGDRAFLREAMEKYPNDPKVDYAALFLGNLSPEEARKWADNFKRSDPDNSMADYASALNYFKSGQTDLALKDLAAAAGKSRWSDYSAEFMQNLEEAYRSAGYSNLDALAAAETGLLLPDLSQLKQLGRKLEDMAKSYQQAGDSASSVTSLQMSIRLGQQLAAVDAQPLITILVGYAVQRNALLVMDPAAVYDSTGQTVQDQLHKLQLQRKQINSAVGQTDGLLAMMSDEDLLSYLERIQNSGEMNAFRWAANKYGLP